MVRCVVMMGVCSDECKKNPRLVTSRHNDWHASDRCECVSESCVLGAYVRNSIAESE
jgi:hypothetical protein